MGVLILSVLAGAAWSIGRFFPPGTKYFTNSLNIREPAATAPVRDILWDPPVPLIESLNDGGETYEPRLSNDGTVIYFVRGKAGGNADIYFARRTSEGWGEPEAFVAINSPADDLGPELSADGRSVYLYSNRAGGLGGYDLWQSQQDVEGNWREPVNLGPQVNSAFNDYGPALTRDGGTLYFSSNRPLPGDMRQPDPTAWQATLREEFFTRTYDLYSVALSEHGAGIAEALTSLNSPHNEGAPALGAFGDFLYFASDRPGGEGGFDLYRAWRIQGEFRTPTNLGATVNTSHNDLDPALSMNGFGLDFSSNRPVAEADKGRGSYKLYHTNSREVFLETIHQERPPIDWAALWRAIGPNLLWALLALALLLLMLLLFKGAQNRKLSLIAKCVLASLAAHLLMMLLFNVWEVAASLAGEFKRAGGVKVALTGSTTHSIATQITGSLVQVDQPKWKSVSHRAEVQPEVPNEVADVEIVPARIQMPQSSVPVTRAVALESQRAPQTLEPRTLDVPAIESRSSIALDAPAAQLHAPVLESEQVTPDSMPSAMQAALVADIASLPESATVEHVPDRSTLSHADSLTRVRIRDADEATPSALLMDRREIPILNASSSFQIAIHTDMPERPAQPSPEVVEASRSPRIDAMASARVETVADLKVPEPAAPTRIPVKSDLARNSHSVLAKTQPAEVQLKASSRVPLEHPVPSIQTSRLENASSLALSLPQSSVPQEAQAEAERAPITPTAVITPSRAQYTDAGASKSIPFQPAESRPLPRTSVDDLSKLPASRAKADIRESNAKPADTKRELTPQAPVQTSIAQTLDLGLPTEMAPPIEEEDLVNSVSEDSGPAIDKPIGVIRGIVTSVITGEPLQNAQVRLSLSDRDTLTAVTDEQGRYELSIPPTPDHFALSASHDEFIPRTVSLERARLEKRGTLKVNFSLEPQNASATATEPEPDVHHLGDDRFSGDINSQFQKRSEGAKFTTTFEIDPAQLQISMERAELRMMIKGVQRRHKIYVNQTLLEKRMDNAPEDGSFGEFIAAFPPELLVGGKNTLKIAALPSDSDIDDFEFVNIRIYLVPAAAQALQTGAANPHPASPAGTQ